MSGLTDIDPQYFNGTGGQFQTYGMLSALARNPTPFSTIISGFEYWANPQNRGEGFITWMSGGQPTIRMGASAVGADTSADGSGVSERLIPEEPMSIILNLAISCAFGPPGMANRYDLLTCPDCVLFSFLPDRGHINDDIPVRAAYRLREGIPAERADERWM